jgi:hypothetical protein
MVPTTLSQLYESSNYIINLGRYYSVVFKLESFSVDVTYFRKSIVVKYFGFLIPDKGIFLFFLQRYGPFNLVLASLTIDAHSSLSNAFTLHRFTPSFLKSSSTSSIHLSLGRPLPHTGILRRKIKRIFSDKVILIPSCSA